MTRVVLVSRAGCHLCDEARRVVAATCARRGEAWHEVDVDADPATARRWGEQVPVVLVDDAVVGFWRIDADRLVAALRRRPI